MAIDSQPIPETLADLAERGVPAGLPSVIECIEQNLICLIAYARISDTRTGKNETGGVSTQHGSMRARIRRLGPQYLIVRRYTDNGLSSAKDEYRPDFEAMLSDLARGTTPEGYPVGGVITVDEDRIYRLPSQRERFIAAFRSRPGRHFIDHAGDQDLYVEGSEIRGLASITISMGEIRKKKARTRLWHEGLAIRGIPHTGGRPFGFSADGMKLDPVESPVVRRAIEACIDGKSWGSITRIFQESGIPTRKGGPWRDQTVKQIVRNPRNAGLRVIDGEIYVDDRTGKPKIGEWETVCSAEEIYKVWERGKPRIRRPDRGAPPPREDERTWTTAPREALSTDKATKYLLSGILSCGKIIPGTGRMCMAKLRGSPDKRSKSGYVYVCPPKTSAGCSGVGRSGAALDELITNLVKAELKERAALAAPEPAWEKDELLQELDRKLNALAQRWVASKISDDCHFRLTAKIEDHLKELQLERADWTAKQTEAHLLSGDIDHLWDNAMDLRQRRATIKGMFTAVIVHPVGRGVKTASAKDIKIVWREGRQTPVNEVHRK
ncbi:recombinase family protein [Planomonospora sp. ID82291]|uniref:recombinase family protein n=1 Tax=Planomonospora sp. ID82291 TaxID=2738136 RepID=UPI0018C3E68C|nr:recombinase family protein [Planomonospora sp. ID82291]MBG0815005.1 recombinase family protein [Planomonospora sp. ID82291]